MRIDSIDVSSWADNPEIGAVMERFNIDLDITSRYLDRSIVGRGNKKTALNVSASAYLM